MFFQSLDQWFDRRLLKPVGIKPGDEGFRLFARRSLAVVFEIQISPACRRNSAGKVNIIGKQTVCRYSFPAEILQQTANVADRA